MEFFDYLLTSYGYDEPILYKDLQFKNYSKPWILKELNVLCRDDMIRKYSKGIYYIPEETPLGKAYLSSYKVLDLKYIHDNKTYYGYYSGLTLQNMFGLSTQVPRVREIVTNNESSKKRKVYLGTHELILRKSRVTITSENVNTLTLLNLISNAYIYDLNKSNLKTIKNFITNTKITKESIIKYSIYFPKKALKLILEKGLLDAAS